MKERPILFSAPMICALLNGSKTQTRRIIKRQPGPYWAPVVGSYNPIVIRNGGYETPGPEIFGASDETEGRKCPYGKPGDRLWVRETFQGPLFDGDQIENYKNDPSAFEKPSYCVYAADGGGAPEFMTPDDEFVCRWRPSIHMPRWASRILLEIVSVRAERLNDCSEADARAEGVTIADKHMNGYCTGEYLPPAVRAYRDLWESINGTGSWDANTWVWCVEFRSIAP